MMQRKMNFLYMRSLLWNWFVPIVNSIAQTQVTECYIDVVSAISAFLMGVDSAFFYSFVQVVKRGLSSQLCRQPEFRTNIFSDERAWAWAD